MKINVTVKCPFCGNENGIGVIKGFYGFKMVCDQCGNEFETTKEQIQDILIELCGEEDGEKTND
jgi:transcription elongation factor Elf1